MTYLVHPRWMGRVVLYSDRIAELAGNVNGYGLSWPGLDVIFSTFYS